MRVLIIGTGYVGLPLAARLAREGHKVYGLGRTLRFDAELASLNFTALQADITRPESLAKLPRGYDWVVLCVASSGGSAEEYRQLYLEGTRNVTAWLAPNPPSKFVYTSSTSVYGQNDGSLVDEASPALPAAATGEVLLQTERLLLDLARAGKMPAVILRLAGIYGPGRGYWFKQFLTGEARIQDEGARYLNMIHRDDVVGAVARALNCATPGEIYNVVDDEPVSQLDFFQWLSRRLGRELPPFQSDPQARPRKRGSSNKRISNRKLRLELGYQLKFPSYREGYEAEIRALRSEIAPGQDG
ncbi:MAG TPA: SDR family oxidoreductase [Verrucomicrobiae bacterium]|nr:SDR family oxidoreductase [Verrucomicrobiae bacterium]